MAHTHRSTCGAFTYLEDGAECFKLYIREAPLQQLHSLAKEASLTSSLASARAELAAILKQAQEAKVSHATSSLRDLPVECVADCEAAIQLTPLQVVPASVIFVVNRSVYGKSAKSPVVGPLALTTYGGHNAIGTSPATKRTTS